MTHIDAWGRPKGEKTSRPMPRPGKITQIITTYNRGHLLRRSLERLEQLTMPDELIVVDDGGEDDTAQVAADFAQRNSERPIEVRYIFNNNPGPSICSLARNIGVRQAKHDWLVTSEPELFWLSDVIAQFKTRHEEYPNDIISSGKVWFAPPDYAPSHGDVENFETAGDYTPPQGGEQAVGWVAPYMALWYKPWLMEVGGWDETFPGPWGWDDIDLLTRLRINGHGQHIDLEVQGIHQWHGLGGDAGQQNEAHFQSKSWHGKEDGALSDEDRYDVIANRDHEWGAIR